MTPTIACTHCGVIEPRRGPAQRFCMNCVSEYAKQYSRAMREVRFQVYGAVKEGRLPRAATLKCVDCGKQARDWDHRDYAKPLDVEPVCRSCNRKRGPALNHPTLQRGANALGLVRDAA